MADDSFSTFHQQCRLGSQYSIMLEVCRLVCSTQQYIFSLPEQQREISCPLSWCWFDLSLCESTGLLGGWCTAYTVFMFWPVFNFTDFGTINVYFTGYTSSVGAMLLGHFSITGYCLSRGGNPVVFKELPSDLSSSSRPAACQEMLTATTSVAMGTVFISTLLAADTFSQAGMTRSGIIALRHEPLLILGCLPFVLVLGEASSFVADTGTEEGVCIPALQVWPDIVFVLG